MPALTAPTATAPVSRRPARGDEVPTREGPEGLEHATREAQREAASSGRPHYVLQWRRDGRGAPMSRNALARTIWDSDDDTFAIAYLVWPDGAIAPFPDPGTAAGRLALLGEQ